MCDPLALEPFEQMTFSNCIYNLYKYTLFTLYLLYEKAAETPQTRNVITSNSVQTPDVLKFNSETSDENNFQDDYLAPVTTDFDANMNENVLELLNQLQQDIRDEEDIAVKSALLLKLLQVLHLFSHYIPCV